MKVIKRTPRVTQDFARGIVSMLKKNEAPFDFVIYEKDGKLGYITYGINIVLTENFTWFIEVDSEKIRMYQSNNQDYILNVQQKINYWLENKFKIEGLREFSDTDFKKCVDKTTKSWKVANETFKSNFEHCYYIYLKNYIYIYRENKK